MSPDTDQGDLQPDSDIDTNYPDETNDESYDSDKSDTETESDVTHTPFELSSEGVQETNQNNSVTSETPVVAERGLVKWNPNG